MYISVYISSFAFFRKISTLVPNEKIILLYKLSLCILGNKNKMNNTAPNDLKIAIDARMVNRTGIGTCIQHWLKDVGYKIALGDPKELETYKDSVPVQIPFISSIYGYKEQLKFPYRALR